MGRCIVELERFYGIKNGNNQHDRVGNSFAPSKTQNELADELGLEVRTMQNYKKLTTLIPELEDLVFIFKVDYLQIMYYNKRVMGLQGTI